MYICMCVAELLSTYISITQHQNNQLQKVEITPQVFGISVSLDVLLSKATSVSSMHLWCDSGSSHTGLPNRAERNAFWSSNFPPLTGCSTLPPLLQCCYPFSGYILVIAPLNLQMHVSAVHASSLNSAFNLISLLCCTNLLCKSLLIMTFFPFTDIHSANISSSSFSLFFRISHAQAKCRDYS